MHIDHHLQARILDELWQGERSFSELKPQAIENSLFMYHLRHLIARGIVEKVDGEYHLTADGTRWAHKRDHTYRTETGLRALVQLFIVRDGKLLVSERRGATAEHMNRYLLPGTVHRFGVTSETCADTLATELDTNRGALMTQIETIIPSQQLHTISDVYAGTRAHDALPEDEPYYHYHWIDLAIIATMTVAEAGALPMLTRNYLDGTLKPREHLLGE